MITKNKHHTTLNEVSPKKNKKKKQKPQERIQPPRTPKQGTYVLQLSDTHMKLSRKVTIKYDHQPKKSKEKPGTEKIDFFFTNT